MRPTFGSPTTWAETRKSERGRCEVRQGRTLRVWDSGVRACTNHWGTRAWGSCAILAVAPSPGRMGKCAFGFLPLQTKPERTIFATFPRSPHQPRASHDSNSKNPRAPPSSRASHHPALSISQTLFDIPRPRRVRLFRRSSSSRLAYGSHNPKLRVFPDPSSNTAHIHPQRLFQPCYI